MNQFCVPSILQMIFFLQYFPFLQSVIMFRNATLNIKNWLYMFDKFTSKPKIKFKYPISLT